MSLDPNLQDLIPSLAALPPPFYHPGEQRSHPSSPSLFVNLIDMSLSHCVQSSSTSDPLVLQALQSMDGSIPSTFCSCLSDWQYAEGILTYKGCVYVPSDPSL